MGGSGNNVDEATRGVDLEQAVTERKLLTNKKSKSMIVGNRYLRECMAEILGSFVLVLFGDGVAAQVVLSDNEAGSYLSMNLGWSIGIIFGIHAAGGISGAHLNPAVTTTMALFGRLPAWKVPGYILSQVIGTFMAGLVVWAVYSPLLAEKDPNAETTMGVFCTFPYKNTPNMNCFLNEVVGSALLLGLIFALADEYNKPASPHSFPTAVGVLIGGIGMAFGVESGYAINPARDFGPRVAASFRYGSQVWTMNDYYFWVPLVAPIVGGAVGAGLYQLFVGIHHNSEDEE
mmetsp:Transcript_52271/g.111300  ORF Transcript_52271/g.111300 Transcript_52271/m.111300 type:complete len:289 (+) Transcript_52271:93-959(+)